MKLHTDVLQTPLKARNGRISFSTLRLFYYKKYIIMETSFRVINLVYLNILGLNI